MDWSGRKTSIRFKTSRLLNKASPCAPPGTCVAQSSVPPSFSWQEDGAIVGWHRPNGRSRDEHDDLSRVRRSTQTAGLRLALVTGARSGEVTAAQWSCVNWARKLIRLPDSKTNAPRTIHLSDAARGPAHRSQGRPLHRRRGEGRRAVQEPGPSLDRGAQVRRLGRRPAARFEAFLMRRWRQAAASACR
jgi:integrase